MAPTHGRKARDLFDDDNEALEYMDDYGLDISRAALLEKLGRHDEAAECNLREGNTLEAIRLFLHDNASSKSRSKAVQCVLDGLWLRMSFGAPGSNLEDPALEEILGHAETMMPSLTNNDVRYEV